MADSTVNLLASMLRDKEVPEQYRKQIAALIKHNDRQEVNGNIAMEIKQ